MLKKAHYIALAVVGLLTLALLNLPPRAASRLKVALGGFFLPLFGLAGSSQSVLDRATWSLVPRRSLIAELESLHRENDRLKLELNASREALQENARLRQQLGWLPKSGWQNRLKPARVVGREPSTWWRTCTIDLGSRDGVRTELPVITSDGLVGRVGTVGLSHSQVVLLGDSACGVSVLVAETRDHGLINGGAAAALDPTIIEVTHLPNSRGVMAGQNVITSGEGPVFPKGIPVGRILDTRSVDGLSMQARIKASANLNRLEEVWVLMP
jgi:rod shape-determining protein MreC